jgi:hypothetical protein
MGLKGELMFKVQKLIAWQKRVEMVDQSFDVADLFPHRLFLQCEELARMITGLIHATSRSERAP